MLASVQHPDQRDGQLFPFAVELIAEPAKHGQHEFLPWLADLSFRDFLRLAKQGFGFCVFHVCSVLRSWAAVYAYFPRSHTKNFARLGTGK